MLRNISLTRLAPALAALAIIPCYAFAADAAGVLNRASNAMGAGDLKSIRYAGDGIGFTFG
jgi:hypothetical protein